MLEPNDPSTQRANLGLFAAGFGFSTAVARRAMTQAG
jgi:hypothetical protein